MNRKSLKFILLAAMLIAIFLLVFLLGIKPQAIETSLSPQKVRPGNILTINVKAKSVFGVKEIFADLGGLETIKFNLVSGNIFYGYWQANWKVSNNVEIKKYQVGLILKDNLGGLTRDNNLWFEDPLFNTRFSTSTISGGFTVTKDALAGSCWNSPTPGQGTKYYWSDGGSDVFDIFGCPMVQLGGVWQALPLYNTAAGVWTNNNYTVGGTNIAVKQGWANSNVYVINIDRTGGTVQNATARLSGNMGSDGGTYKWTRTFADEGITWRYCQNQDSSTLNATGGDSNFFLSIFSTDSIYSQSSTCYWSSDNLESVLTNAALPITYYISWGQMSGTIYSNWVAADWNATNLSPNIPVLIYPSNGAVDLPLLPSFQFGCSDPGGENCTKFDLMVDNNSNFSSPEINLSGSAGSWPSSSTISYEATTTLSYNTKYYWKARVFDGTSYSSWSDGSWNFTTLNLAPNTPTLDAPSNGATVNSLRPTLQFFCSDPNGDNCTKFDLQINDQPSFSSPLIDIQNYAGSWASGAIIPYTLASDLSAHTAYYWRSRVFDGKDWSSWSDGSWNFVTFNRIPAAPFLTAPENGIKEIDSSLSLEFSYSDLDADPCTKFDLQVSTSSAFTSTVINELNHAGSWPSGSIISYSATVPYGNKYYWRARVFDGYDWSGWSGGTGLNLGNEGDISIESDSNCSVSNTKNLYCWGWNAWGGLGNNTTINASVPVQVVGAGGVGYLTEVSKAAPGYGHSCALKTDGTVWCWGSSRYGQLGINIITEFQGTPVQVLGVGGSGHLTGVSQIDSGYWDSCALKADDTVWCWGGNEYGQLGNNTTTHSSTPVQVLGVGGSGYLTGVSQISAASVHTCALKVDGTAYCWGENGRGQLGNNTTTHSSTPVQVLGVGGSGYLTGVSQISAGETLSCALKTDGTVWCWGDNGYGELGQGTSDSLSHPTPVQVLGVGGSGYLTGVSQISAGYNHVCAFKFDNTVWCWGGNGYGQLGNNTTTHSSTPVQVLGVGGSGYLTGVSKVAAGLNHTCVLNSDGTIYCWGYNAHGQLGNNTTTTNAVPVQVLKGAAQSEDIEGLWSFTVKIEPQKFTIKKADGCSCSNAEECYSGSCGSGVCGSSGPSAANLIAPEEDSSNYCSYWLNASNGNSVETGNNGAVPFKWTYVDSGGKHLETYYMRFSTSSDVDSPNPAVDQSWSGRTESSGSDITQQIPVKINPGLNELAYGQTYNWWVKVCNEDNAVCSGWTKALSSFSTPVKHYPIVKIAWNRKVLIAGEDIRFCTTADINNEEDPCYSTCWTGPEGSTPEVGDFAGYWKCSVCYNSSNQKQACQDVSGTQYNWYFPGAEEVDYEFQSSTLAVSSNPFVKFKTTGKSKTVKLNVTGSCCGGYGSIDIVQPIPKWKEASPF